MSEMYPAATRNQGDILVVECPHCRGDVKMPSRDAVLEEAARWAEDMKITEQGVTRKPRDGYWIADAIRALKKKP